MEISFLPIAKAELDDTFDWYEEQMIGLGHDFLETFTNTLKLIVSYPELPPLMSGNIRRCLLNRFPYAIYYGIANARIVVIAVSHLRRKPDYWLERLQNSNQSG